MSPFFRANVRFLTPQEGGLSENLWFSSEDWDYEALLDFGFGTTEEGVPIRSIARLAPEDPERRTIEPGSEHVLRIGTTCPERYIVPGAEFDVLHGPREVVAKGVVIGHIEN